jgi:hypothetical protein
LLNIFFCSPWWSNLYFPNCSDPVISLRTILFKIFCKLSEFQFGRRDYSQNHTTTTKALFPRTTVSMTKNQNSFCTLVICLPLFLFVLSSHLLKLCWAALHTPAPDHQLAENH